MHLVVNSFSQSFGIHHQVLVSWSKWRCNDKQLIFSGPSNSWTIHGLWPDHCDGTYDSSCDSTRAYTNITAILQSYGKNDLLAYMNTYWVDINGADETFWEHEWAKHGTCISTFKPSCYTSYTAQEEVPDFFQKTVDLFQTLDSYGVSKLIVYQVMSKTNRLPGPCKSRYCPVKHSNLHRGRHPSSSQSLVWLYRNDSLHFECSQSNLVFLRS